MDKFDDFVKQKAKDEVDKFILPKSFENKMQDTLDNLDSVKMNKKWYVNRKIMAIVACFAFVILIGVNSSNNNFGNKASMKLASEEHVSRDGLADNSNAPESYGLNNSRANIDINGIQSITIKYLEKDTKFKNINNKEDIEKVINYLSSLEILNINSDIGLEWDFLIQVNGKVNNSIIIKDNFISIDDEVYEISNWNKNNFIDLYDSLEYEEKYIKYCPTN